MSRRAWMAIVTLLGVLLVAAGAGAAATGNRRLMMLAVCVCVLPLLCFALMKRPGVLAAIPGIVLGFMPFAAVQGTGFPLVIALTPTRAGTGTLDPAGSGQTGARALWSSTRSGHWPWAPW